MVFKNIAKGRMAILNRMTTAPPPLQSEWMYIFTFAFANAIFIQLLDDHLQKAGPSVWSFARRRSLRMIICNHEKGMKNAFSRPFPTRLNVFEYQRIKIRWKIRGEREFPFALQILGKFSRIYKANGNSRSPTVKNGCKFSHLLVVRAIGADPPPPYGQLDRKMFFDVSPKDLGPRRWTL